MKKKDVLDIMVTQVSGLNYYLGVMQNNATKKEVREYGLQNFKHYLSELQENVDKIEKMKWD